MNWGSSSGAILQSLSKFAPEVTGLTSDGNTPDITKAKPTDEPMAQRLLNRI
jgi:hypothetical protein